MCYLLLLGVLCLVETGCTSVYRRTRSHLPSEPAAELSLRVSEAGQAQRVTRQAGQKLLDNLQQQKPREVSAVDFDRFEAAVFDLDRRVLAARDSAARCSRPADLAAEIERLSQQTQSWLEYVQSYRGADPSTQAQQLQKLLR